MTSARHRDVPEPAPRCPRLLRLALPATAATLVTGAVVVAAVWSGAHPKPVEVADAPATSMVVHLDGGGPPFRAERARSFSRSAQRVTLQRKPDVKDSEFMTAPLNLWPTPAEKGKPLAVLEEGGKVAVTGVRKAGFAQILHAGQVRWVHHRYLADRMPKPPEPPQAPAAGTAHTAHTGSTARTAGTGSKVPAGSTGSTGAVSAGLSSAPCPDGSRTEPGLTSAAVRLFRAACAAFPALSSYGGYDGHGEHSSGRAIDFMVTDSSLGQALADWARAHASELDLFDVIWSQRIWTPVRSSEGWRSMSDRGSSTANHFDHVHISVN